MSARASAELSAANISIRRTGVFIGAEVRGVDLTKPLSTGEIETLRQAHAEYEVLVFPDQAISGADLMRFGRCFGELSVHPFSSSTEDNPELIVYDHKEGNPPVSTDVWHTDETFRATPPMGTMLASKIIPELGGDTVFCSMSAAYDSLSDRLAQFVSGLEAVHDFKPFRQLFANSSEGLKKLHAYEERYPPATHPVVRVHPVTGRKVLFVNPQFTTHIKGMSERESRSLLDTLFATTSILELHYRHRWSADMVVFWDNRAAQHSAMHDYYPQRRLMERVTIAGDRPVGDAPAPDPSTLRKFKMPPITAFAGSRARRRLDDC